MAQNETINGVAHAKRVLAEAGIKMPFDKGYQAWQEGRNKAAEPVVVVAEAVESKSETKEGKK